MRRRQRRRRCPKKNGVVLERQKKYKFRLGRTNRSRHYHHQPRNGLLPHVQSQPPNRSESALNGANYHFALFSCVLVATMPNILKWILFLLKLRTWHCAFVRPRPTAFGGAKRGSDFGRFGSGSPPAATTAGDFAGFKIQLTICNLAGNFQLNSDKMDAGMKAATTNGYPVNGESVRRKTTLLYSVLYREKCATAVLDQFHQKLSFSFIQVIHHRPVQWFLPCSQINRESISIAQDCDYTGY